MAVAALRCVLAVRGPWRRVVGPGGRPGGVSAELSAFRALCTFLGAWAESTRVLLPLSMNRRLLASLCCLACVIGDTDGTESVSQTGGNRGVGLGSTSLHGSWEEAAKRASSESAGDGGAACDSAVLVSSLRNRCALNAWRSKYAASSVVFCAVLLSALILARR